MTTPIEEEIPEGFSKPLSKAEYEALKLKYKSRAAQVSYRSGYNEHLRVILPSHIHGEWVKNTPFDINEAKMNGFIVDTIYACNTNIHGKKDGSPTIVQDVIHMITPKANKEALDELYHEEYIKRHGDPGKKKLSMYEEDKSNAEGIKDTPEGLSLIEEVEGDTTERIRGDVLKERLKES